MKPQDYSAEGAYDEAMEASANLLQLYSRESSTSSGYSSDTETSPMQGLEESSVSSKTSCCSSFSSALSSAGSEDSNSSQESDDIESEIQFLQEKQKLLKRAIAAMKREDAYEASRARKSIEGKQEREASPLWSEAKDILDILNLQDGDQCVVDDRPLCDAEEHRTERPSKKTKIDVSTVARVTSESLLDGLFPSNVTPSPAASTLCDFRGAWVGQTLARTLSAIGSTSDDESSEKSHSSQWQVVNDSNLGFLVVPPPLLALSNSVELRDALALSTQPRLVTMSMPPFCVVHANKAFCELSGLGSADIIGKPVESLLHVSQGPVSNVLEIPTSGALNRSLALAIKSCTLELTPVTDKFRNPSGGMSHLLVQLHSHGVEGAGDTDGMARSFHSKNIVDTDYNHRLVGTVG